MIKLTKEQLLEAVKEVDNALEAKDIVNNLFQKFGTVIDPGFYAASAYAALMPEDDLYYSVILVSVENRIAVIKAIRNLTGWDLSPSVSATDSLPFVLGEHLYKYNAEEWRDKLTEAGATVELKKG